MSHNPARRVKRFKQPLPPTQPLNQLHESRDTRFFVPGSVSSGNHALRRHTNRPDALRGAVLIALAIVTIGLYFVLWELQRFPFALVLKAGLTQGRTTASQSSGHSEPASTPYPPRVVLWRENDQLPGGAIGEEANPSQEHVDAFSRESGGTSLNAWPPPVTHILKDHAPEEPAVDRTNGGDIAKLSSFNASHCRGTCRFLLPVRIGEQESKARIHMMQLLVLAKRLGRTTVLPNVRKGRMSACSEWPFGVYYDTDGFVRDGDVSGSWSTIDLEKFAEWVDERVVPPSSFVVAMESLRRDHHDLPVSQKVSEDISFTARKTVAHPKTLSCLGSRLARLRSSLPKTVLSLSIASRSLKTELNTFARLAQLLSDSPLDSLDSDTNFHLPDLMMEPGHGYTTPQYTNGSTLSLADIDVLVLDYDLRHPLLTATTQVNLHYAPALYDLGDRLSDNLGPFLGVHWRMENVPLENLAWCAASLVSTLRAILQDDTMGKDVQHVWFATDYPRPPGVSMDSVHFLVDEDQALKDVGRAGNGRPLRNGGPKRKSSTFKTVSFEHDDAIGILVEAFKSGGELETWKLTDLAEQLRRYPYVEGKFDMNETLLTDSGVFGILDKLVIVQAKTFISGSMDCSKSSSFSKQVIEARRELFEAEQGKDVVRNVVDYFGKW